MSYVVFGQDVRALKKRVTYVNGSGGTLTVKEGEPMCYNFDTTNNYLGYDPYDSTEKTTTTEGYQNEGKYLFVENPSSTNLMWFAGVVAQGGWCGKQVTNGSSLDLEIYVPNGAIIPVRADIYVTTGKTVLAVEASSQELTVPLAASNARPVAIAQETVDRSSTAGLTLAKLAPDLFLYQVNGTTALDIPDEATAAVTLNTISFSNAGTGGPIRGLYAVGEIAGAGHSTYGMWKFRTYLSAAASATVHTLCANLHFKDDAEITDAGEWASSPLYVTVETETTTSAADLSGGSIAGIYFGYYVDESTGAPSKAYLLQTNNHASYNWDGLLRIAAGDLGDAAMTGDHAFDSADKAIPVLVDSTTYYIPLMNNKGD